MLYRILCAAVGCTTFLWMQIASAQGLPPGMTLVQSVEGITEYRLANGLQLLLIPDSGKPTTTVNMTYRVGSRHENYGETGMAHLLEHLLFKGSPKHPAVWAEFTKRGLAANGSTWYDRTNYFASFSANDENLKWYLSWQADAMINSFVARRDLDTEMTVVRNEMEMGENNPERILFEKTLATMYQWHNYGKTTIGARTDVENVDIARLQEFYRRYYQPDNAALIVAGKFEAPKVLAWVGQAFGKLKKPTRKLPVQYTLEAQQDGERSVVLRRVGGVPLLFAAYHVPPALHPDYAAVEVLNLVLGDTPSGRLHKRLTEKQLAASTQAFAEGLADPGFTLYGAQLAPGQSTDQAQAEMLATIESFTSEPMTEVELKRAKARWLNDWEQANTNPETVGVALSESVAQGDWRAYFLLRDRVRALTLADVQRVADQRLIPANRTLGTYVPTEKPVRAPAPSKVNVAAELKAFKPQVAAAAVEVFESTPANLDLRTQRFDLGGLKVALLPKGSRGSAVRAVLTLNFGNVKTLFGHGNVPEMVASMLDKGTSTLTRQQVQDRLDELMTEMNIAGEADRVVVTLSSRREYLPQAIMLAADLLRNPVFPPDVLEEGKRLALAGIEEQRKEPGAVAANAVARWGNPYPRGDARYAKSFDEMVEDVKAPSVSQLRAFHKRFYGVENAEFAAVGDMEVAAVRSALEVALGGWKSGEPYTRVPHPLVPIKAERMVLVTPDKQNATMLAQLKVPLADHDEDYPALMLANHLIGSGGNSRLWRRIRETNGLSYDVRSGIQWSSHEPHSEWKASAIFAPQNRAKVEAAFREELGRVLKEGFTAQELDEGKRGVLAFRRLSRAQDKNVAASLVQNLHLGRTFAISAQVDEALSKLTLEQVNAVARRYLKPESLVMVLAGDFKP